LDLMSIWCFNRSSVHGDSLWLCIRGKYASPNHRAFWQS
jgi:hypothetical protein